MAPIQKEQSRKATAVGCLLALRSVAWKRARLLLFLSSLALSLLAVEAVARWGLASSEQRKIGARALLLRDKNTFTAANKKDCAWGDSLMAHPYLAYVHHRRPPCGIENANNAGMLSPHPLPLERDPRFFTILLEGGSVAQQLGSGAWLEQALERRYRLENGKQFRVINAAMGATTYPRQSILTVLFGHAVDAILSVDGFNEVSVNDPMQGLLLGAPNPLYLAQVKTEGASRLVGRIELSRLIREQMASVPALSQSFFWYFLVEGLSSAALGHSRPSGGVKSHDLSQGTYLESYLAPSSWTAERRYAWHSERYLEGIRVNQALAHSLGLQYAHFLQPVPNLFKPLTRKERAVAWSAFPSDYYLNLERKLTAFGLQGVQSFSLLRIFEDEHSEVYSDLVHCKMSGDNSPGYEKMAKVIGEQLGPAWGLARK